MDAAGKDDAGNLYANPQKLWEAVGWRAGGGASEPAAGKEEEEEEQKGGGKRPRWYKTNVEYWDAQEATDNGVLGGYGFVSDIDLRDSKAFVLKAMGEALKEAAASKRKVVACDCGAGVGRVAEALLLQLCDEVDLVEPSAHLLAAAKKRLGSTSGPRRFPAAHRAVHYFQAGLEAFDPEPGRYDLLWAQWAMLYLTDDDAVDFLRRCASALRPGGLVFIKENVISEGFLVDTDDASVTRSHAYNTELFTAKTGLELAHTALQRGFPKQLFKVRMYALRVAPVESTAAAATEEQPPEEA